MFRTSYFYYPRELRCSSWRCVLNWIYVIVCGSSIRLPQNEHVIMEISIDWCRFIKTGWHPECSYKNSLPPKMVSRKCSIIPTLEFGCNGLFNGTIKHSNLLRSVWRLLLVIRWTCRTYHREGLSNIECHFVAPHMFLRNCYFVTGERFDTRSPGNVGNGHRSLLEYFNST